MPLVFSAVFRQLRQRLGADQLQSLACVVAVDLLHIQLAVDAKERRADYRDDDGRADRAENVGDGIGDRHDVQHRLDLVGGQTEAVDRVSAKAHGCGKCLRACIESDGGAKIVAEEFRNPHAHKQAEHALNRREDRLRNAVLRDAAHELRADAVTDGEEEHQEGEGLERSGDRNADLTDDHRRDQRCRYSAETDTLEGEGAEVVPECQGEKNCNFRISPERAHKPINHGAILWFRF